MPEVRKYANELAGLINERDSGQAAVDKITALMRAADTAGERNQQLQLEKQRAAFTKQVASLDQEILKATKARDFEGARQLQIDLSIRINAAMEAYVSWRKMINEYEYSVANGRFAPEPEEGKAPQGFTRKMADLDLEEAKAEAERRLAFAADAVPNRAVILL